MRELYIWDTREMDIQMVDIPLHRPAEDHADRQKRGRK
jgi:hypothetical protein